MSDLIVPRHVGYIVDGNRRWAKKHGIPSYEGHLAGYNALKEVAIATLEAGTEYMSAYTWSTENWKRTQEEAMRFMSLTLIVLKSDLPIFAEKNIRLRVLGSREGLDKKLIKAIDNAEHATENNTGGTFALCFNYGGQLEIVDAVKKIVQAGTKEDDVTEALISQYIYEPEVPPMDVIVRTGGEQRLSNFMLWRSAYSELIFLKKFWPDMTKDDVMAILKEYSKRQRRFGG
jgi:undecaprenyl diphosphate synthase